MVRLKNQFIYNPYQPDEPIVTSDKFGKDAKQVDLDTKLAIRDFIKMLPNEKFVDKVGEFRAFSLLTAIRKPGDIIELDDDHYKWFVELVDANGTKLFGVINHSFREALSNNIGDKKE